MGKLIVLDGTDGSGKQTQSELLVQRLKNEGYNAKRISYPNYESDSSYFVKKNLDGNIKTTNPYIISTFYAIDRVLSKDEDFKDFENTDLIVVADRYVSSNMIHQGSKFNNIKDKLKFLDWLYDLEYKHFKLPLPDLTLFLDMPIGYTLRLMASRTTTDVYEQDINHLKEAYNNACAIAFIYGWECINCIKNDEIKSKQEINEAIYSVIKTKVLSNGRS